MLIKFHPYHESYLSRLKAIWAGWDGCPIFQILPVTNTAATVQMPWFHTYLEIVCIPHLLSRGCCLRSLALLIFNTVSWEHGDHFVSVTREVIKTAFRLSSMFSHRCAQYISRSLISRNGNHWFTERCLYVLKEHVGVIPEQVWFSIIVLICV